jgi:hypothetical protein
MVSVLVLARFCSPSSELQMAESWYYKTTLDDLLGINPKNAVIHKLTLNKNLLLQ